MGSTMKTWRRWLAALGVAALAACGGGGDEAGTPIFGDGSAPLAADLTLALSAGTLSNGGTETVRATATAVDANRNAISGIPVTLRVDNDAVVTVSGDTTDAAGRLTGEVSVGSSKVNRTITVTAISGKLTKKASFQVIGTRINATALPAVLQPGQAGRIDYVVVDANGTPMPGVTLTVNGPSGVEARGTADANGAYRFDYTAPASTGSYTITATGAGVNPPVTTSIIVQAAGAGAIPPAPLDSVISASVRATPSVVAVNSPSTSNRTELRALFVGVDNKPVRNIRVRFDLFGEASRNIGGTITSGTDVVYSNDAGVAVAAYLPGGRSSPTDGVTIRACWDYDDFPVGSCPNAVTTTVTVIAEPLSVSIGTDELIVSGDLTYVKRFVVQVNDASGLAKPDVVVSPQVDLASYAKGFWERIGAPVNQWVQNVVTGGCGNEDLNRNGVAEVFAGGNAEDANGNAQLDPRKADVAVAIEGSNRTDELGQVKLRLTYPRNVASWVEFNLTVAAAGVAGTEGRATYNGVLPVPADAVKAEGAPAFVLSPYGVEPSDFVEVTDGTTSAMLCTNPR